jgi:hypothetical protein
VSGWMLVDGHTHRIAKAPNGAWGMYCPQRGPDSLIYAATWPWVLVTLMRGTTCPHDDLLYGREAR